MVCTIRGRGKHNCSKT